MNDVHYLVECFDDALNYYQVEDVIPKVEFDSIYKEIKQYGRSGQIKSVQGSADFVDQFYKSSGFAKTGASSVNSNKARHGEKNSGVQRMGEISSARRERSSSNGSGDRQSSSEDRQKYSRELDFKLTSLEKTEESGKVSKRHALPENPSKSPKVDPESPITWSVLKASLEQTAKDQGKQKELYLASVVYRGLPGTTGSPNLSAGEIKKMKANYTHDRVYSKKNAFDLIDALSGAGSLLQKTKSAFADKVWQALNDCETMEEKRAFARDAAEYWVAKVLTEGKSVNPDYADYAEQLTYFRTGIGSLAFREEMRSKKQKSAPPDRLYMLP